MTRVIVTPPVLAPAALAELKDWLGITISADDAGLTGLLSTALEVCADYIGMVPLSATYEETVCVPTGRMAMPGPEDWQSCTYPGDWQTRATHDGWHRLSLRPVSAFVSVEALSSTGQRTALATDRYGVRIDGDGQGAIRIPAGSGLDRVVVRYCAGMADQWSGLPESLRHGIMRLAAHQYRQRESTGADALPPASVTALWRPWRRMRLA
ncbi:head-tail connector protein [Novosphingobium sp. KACC 22771]|uniref:head-tail connector protein n=1 Tax=Novosphingobium sp. KACC 22771 TaxID=3025670 RepID=UPI002366C57F|nr:hypothetical protein [Novosphingobium sp. KACC 22771]WDF72392.1 hypothetical protein PQ467_16650 [Novosphingobium sp. KACC 22771]